MDKTKTGKDSEITLPPSVLEVLREHVARLGEVASDLIFPGKRGALLTRNVLQVPFKTIAAEMGLAFPLTPRAMRRTFNDIARLVGINDIVTRSISGHQTSAMQAHYSTAADIEQRDAVAKVHEVASGAVGMDSRLQARLGTGRRGEER
jgi:site-specific recombinase XerD